MIAGKRRFRQPCASKLIWEQVERRPLNKHFLAMKKDRVKRSPRRYGVAEIYGHDFAKLKPEEIRHYAVVVHKDQPCPFRGKECNKKRGVCSLRLFEKTGDSVTPVSEPLVSVCPERFREGEIVTSWVGETLLGTSSSALVSEVDFLQGPANEEDEEGEPVGRIDNILLCPGTEPLVWCAVELQAVYFSGKGMASQFAEFAKWSAPGIPWPNMVRRPDYRSSGPKRLMPQLQTKVPTLRRWGKKMAVVTDRSFFENMGRMEKVTDVSNCDIVWFVVDYEPSDSGFKLVSYEKHFITLERAIEGLIAGEPVSLIEFERRICDKLLKAQPKKDRVR
jgi:restriction endonuclease NotI